MTSCFPSSLIHEYGRIYPIHIALIFYKTLPSYVLDIILDDSHPIFKSPNNYPSINPTDWPDDVSGNPALQTDKNYGEKYFKSKHGKSILMVDGEEIIEAVTSDQVDDSLNQELRNAIINFVGIYGETPQG